MANEPSALAVETGIEAASNAVSALPMGQRAWSSKEHMIAETAASAALAAIPDRSYQGRVHDWMLACFGPEISADTMERNHRFIEEALELVQANGCTRGEARQLVDYVFGRPVGELAQEIGGVMVTLAALCNASGANMEAAAETELARVWTKVEKIRAKQAAKPKHSPLPEAVAIPDRYAEGFEAGKRAAEQIARPSIPRPCDCTDCDCGNKDDAQTVAAWDDATGTADAIAALKPEDPTDAG